MANRSWPRYSTVPVVAGIRISHPDRLIYPECGLSKLDLVRYYEEIGDWIVPHVQGRPLTLVHCPAGVRGAWRKFDWSSTFSRLDMDNIKPNNDYRNASTFGNFGFTPDSRQTLRGTLFHVSSRVGTPGVDAPGFTSFGPNNHAEGLERAEEVQWNRRHFLKTAVGAVVGATVTPIFKTDGRRPQTPRIVISTISPGSACQISTTRCTIRSNQPL